MNSFVRGTPIVLVQRFWTQDPVTLARTLTDPGTVTFTVMDPNGGVTEYVSGTDLNVTNPSVGVWLCALDPQLPTGIYTYNVQGAAPVEIGFNDEFIVLASASLDPASPRVLTFGPRQPWINGSDVFDLDPSIVAAVEDASLLDQDAAVASELMFLASGQQFPGLGKQKVRPCRQGCGCFGALGSLDSWYWTTSWFGGSGMWRDERGAQCGCGSESYIRLEGFPVSEIVEVKIDGDILDPSGYQLEGARDLLRLADVGPPVINRVWPSCQNLALPDTAPGTLSVTYTFGQPPPLSGVRAAAQLAAELYKGHTTGKCRLPNRVIQQTRQGVQYSRLVPTGELFRKGATGLEFVDLFIGAVNPMGMIRPPAIYSPDSQPFAVVEGQDWY